MPGRDGPPSGGEKDTWLNKLGLASRLYKYSRKLPKFGIAAQAGIHFAFERPMKSCFRGNDREGVLSSRE